MTRHNNIPVSVVVLESVIYAKSSDMMLAHLTTLCMVVTTNFYINIEGSGTSYIVMLMNANVHHKLPLLMNRSPYNQHAINFFSIFL